MTLTLELPPELEYQLHEAAVRSGQAPETVAIAALAKNLRDVMDALMPPPTNSTGLGANELSPEEIAEIDAALDELAAIGADIPPPTEYISYSRDDIYCDHD